MFYVQIKYKLLTYFFIWTRTHHALQHVLFNVVAVLSSISNN